MFGSAAMTVAPTTVPSLLKCWSIPTLRPRITGFVIAGAPAPFPFCSAVSTSSFLVSSVTVRSLELDLDVDARRKVQLHQRVDRLLRRIVDVDEPLVRADLELLA